MSLSEEKEWFKENISGALAGHLHQFKDVADRLGRLRGGDSNAQLVLIGRMDSAVTQLCNAGIAWESHNEELVQAAIAMRESTSRLEDTRGLLADRVTDLEAARGCVEEKINIQKELIRAENALEMQHLRNDLLLAQNQLQETKAELRAASVVSTERQESITLLEKQRCQLESDLSQSACRLQAVEVGFAEQSSISSTLQGWQQQLELENSALREELLGVQDRLRVSEHSLTVSEEQSRSSGAEVLELKAKATTDATTIKALRNSASDLEKDRDRIAGSVERLQQECTKLGDENKRLQSEVEVLNRAGTKVSAREKKALEACDAAQRNVVDLKKELRDSGLAISSARARVSRLEGENATLDRRADEAMAREQELRDSGAGDVLKAISDLKRRSYMEREEMSQARREHETARDELRARAERTGDQIEALLRSIQSVVGSVQDVRSEAQLGSASIKSLINRLSDNVEARTGSSPTRALKRRRLDDTTFEDEAEEVPQTTVDGPLGLRSSPVSSSFVPDLSATGLGAVSSLVPSMPEAVVVPVAEVIAPASLPPVQPQANLWSLVDFGGDQALEDEFKQAFAGWTTSEMVTEFERVCIKRTRTRPEKTCLTTKCLGDGKKKSQFKGGEMDTNLRANCPTHSVEAGTCMKLAYLDGMEDTPYTPGQLRYSIRRRV